MTDKIGLALSLALDKVAAVPAAWWFVIGIGLASVPAAIGITALVKWQHFKKYAVKLETHFIVMNVAFWGFLLSIADFVVAQATNILPLGSLFPFLTKAWPIISFSAIIVHSVSTAMKAWWQDRQAGKKLAKPVVDPALLDKLDRQMNPNGVSPVPPQPTQSGSADLFS